MLLYLIGYWWYTSVVGFTSLKRKNSILMFIFFASYYMCFYSYQLNKSNMLLIKLYISVINVLYL